MRAASALITVSDVHLWHKAPIARAKEPDWFAAMLRPLKQVRRLQKALSEAAGYTVPLVYAGDIFDRPNPPPELISFAIKHLPHGYSVAGQHDLPYHSYEDVKKSAYWTLCEAGVLTHLDANDDGPMGAGTVRLWGYSWNRPVKVVIDPRMGLCIDVAVVHAYVWCKGCKYPDAPEQGHFTKWSEKLTGFEVAVFGDNHLGFVRKSPGTTVLNNGTLMRRRSDEADYQPCVGVVYADGSVERIPLDCTDDVIDCTENKTLSADDKANFELFLQTLQTLKGNGKDYRASLLAYMDARGLTPGARRLVLAAMGDDV